MVNITFIKDGNQFELPTTLNNNYLKASHKANIRDVNKKKKKIAVTRTIEKELKFFMNSQQRIICNNLLHWICYKKEELA